MNIMIAVSRLINSTYIFLSLRAHLTSSKNLYLALNFEFHFVTECVTVTIKNKNGRSLPLISVTRILLLNFPCSQCETIRTHRTLLQYCCDICSEREHNEIVYFPSSLADPCIKDQKEFRSRKLTVFYFVYPNILDIPPSIMQLSHRFLKHFLSQYAFTFHALSETFTHVFPVISQLLKVISVGKCKCPVDEVCQLVKSLNDCLLPKQY